MSLLSLKGDSSWAVVLIVSRPLVWGPEPHRHGRIAYAVLACLLPAQWLPCPGGHSWQKGPELSGGTLSSACSSSKTFLCSSQNLPPITGEKVCGRYTLFRRPFCHLLPSLSLTCHLSSSVPTCLDSFALSSQLCLLHLRWSLPCLSTNAICFKPSHISLVHPPQPNFLLSTTKPRSYPHHLHSQI